MGNRIKRLLLVGLLAVPILASGARAMEYAYEVHICFVAPSDDAERRVRDAVAALADANPGVPVRAVERRREEFFPSSDQEVPAGVYLRVVDLRDGSPVRDMDLNWGLPLRDDDSVARALDDIVAFSRELDVSRDVLPGFALYHPANPLPVLDPGAFPASRVEVYFFYDSAGALVVPGRVRLAQNALFSPFMDRIQNRTLINLSVDLGDPANAETAASDKIPRDSAAVFSLRDGVHGELTIIPMDRFDDDEAFRDAVMAAVEGEVKALEESGE